MEKLCGAFTDNYINSIVDRVSFVFTGSITNLSPAQLWMVKHASNYIRHNNKTPLLR